MHGIVETRQNRLTGIILMLAGVAWVGGYFSIHYGAVFNALDYITANIMLPLGGLFIALFVGWVMPAQRTLYESGMAGGPAYRSWRFVLRYIAPIGILVVFINSFL